MFRIMDAIWRAEGLDLHLRPYRVVATGANSGLIEVCFGFLLFILHVLKLC